MLVSRFRSSQTRAGPSDAHFGIKGTLELFDFWCGFGFEVPKGAFGYNGRNFKSTALVPRTRSSRTPCGKCDRELRVQRGTRIIELPSGPWIPKFVSERAAVLTNFGIRPLGVARKGTVDRSRFVATVIFEVVPGTARRASPRRSR